MTTMKRATRAAPARLPGPRWDRGSARAPVPGRATPDRGPRTTQPRAAAAAWAMTAATAAGWDRYTEWLPGTSVSVAPVRSAIERWAGGGIIRSSVAIRYQLGLCRHNALLAQGFRQLCK